MKLGALGAKIQELLLLTLTSGITFPSYCISLKTYLKHTELQALNKESLLVGKYIPLHDVINIKAEKYVPFSTDNTDIHLYCISF